MKCLKCFSDNLGLLIVLLDHLLIVNKEYKSLNKLEIQDIFTKMRNGLETVASYFRGKNYFDGDGTQNYLVFQGV